MEWVQNLFTAIQVANVVALINSCTLIRLLWSPFFASKRNSSMRESSSSYSVNAPFLHNDRAASHRLQYV